MESEKNRLSLAKIAQRQAEIHALLGSGSVLGEIGERVAAEVCGGSRITGTGNDLMRIAPPEWNRPAPIGIAADTGRPEVRPTKEILEEKGLVRALTRYERWTGDRGQSRVQLGEVKCRQLDRRFGDYNQLLDTRGGGPKTDFVPLVDFYVFIIFGKSGELLKCVEVPLEELIEYVKSDVGRGGAWNYKLAISLGMDLGIDNTDAAIDAMNRLEAVPDPKNRRL